MKWGRERSEHAVWICEQDSPSRLLKLEEMVDRRKCAPLGGNLRARADVAYAMAEKRAQSIC